MRFPRRQGGRKGGREDRWKRRRKEERKEEYIKASLILRMEGKVPKKI